MFWYTLDILIVTSLTCVLTLHALHNGALTTPICKVLGGWLLELAGADVVSDGQPVHV
jgi:hypothetical protein